MSDATSVAEDYASTLDSQVAAALQSATIASSNLTGATENFDNSLQKAHGTITGPVASAFAGMISSLTKVYGNTKTAESVANAYARQLGLTSGQVKTLDSQVSGLVGSARPAAQPRAHHDHHRLRHPRHSGHREGRHPADPQRPPDGHLGGCGRTGPGR